MLIILQRIVYPPEYPTDVCPTTSYQGQWSTNYVCDHPDYQEFCTDGYPDPNKGLFYNDLGSGGIDWDAIYSYCLNNPEYCVPGHAMYPKILNDMYCTTENIPTPVAEFLFMRLDFFNSSGTVIQSDELYTWAEESPVNYITFNMDFITAWDTVITRTAISADDNVDGDPTGFFHVITERWQGVAGGGEQFVEENYYVSDEQTISTGWFVDDEVIPAHIVTDDAIEGYDSLLRITFRIQQTAQSGSQIYAEQQVIVTYIYIDDPLLGDLNNDGGWNALDLVLLVN